MTWELEGTNFILQMRLEFFGKAELEKHTNKAVTHRYKVWGLKKLTKLYPRFLIEKKSESFLFFYLHFP